MQLKIPGTVPNNYMLRLSKSVSDILTLAKRKATYQTATITVMLSSGVDSVAIAHFVAKNKHQLSNILGVPTTSLVVQAFHFNHKLRDQNDLMEKSAVAFCNDFNIPLTLKQSSGILVSEAHARNARMTALTESIKDSITLTAHHLNDCVESYLLNTLRGHEGYLPIPFFTKLQNCVMSHPFIFNTKNDFIEYCKHFNLNKYIVEDETNKTTKGSRRNLIRNEILPILHRENIVLNKTISNKMSTRLQELMNEEG